MLISGPCSLENKAQGFRVAEFVKSCNATYLRFGLFKGQNRPIVNGKPEYVGLGYEGMPILQEIYHKFKLPIVCDAQSIEQMGFLMSYDFIIPMIGARNMDNLCLLRETKLLNDTYKVPKIILKRGPSATIDEFIGAAEHLGGPERVILCERGIVSYDRTPQTRWRLDFVGVAYVKQYYREYTIIIDPSHGSGDRQLVPLLCKAGLAIADGLMVEVHYDPDSSPTDAGQTIDFETFKQIAEEYHGKQPDKPICTNADAH